MKKNNIEVLYEQQDLIIGSDTEFYFTYLDYLAEYYPKDSWEYILKYPNKFDGLYDYMYTKLENYFENYFPQEWILFKSSNDEIEFINYIIYSFGVRDQLDRRDCE